MVEKVEGRIDRHGGDIDEGSTRNRYRRRLFAKPLALADIARGVGQKLGIPAFHALRLGTPKTSHQAIEQAFVT